MGSRNELNYVNVFEKQRLSESIIGITKEIQKQAVFIFIFIFVCFFFFFKNLRKSFILFLLLGVHSATQNRIVRLKPFEKQKGSNEF